MSKLKVGANIKNYNEVTELIINLINKMDEFNAEFLVNLSYNYTQGTSLNIDKKEMSRIVHTILEVMQEESYITYLNGRYSVLSKDYTVNKYNEHDKNSQIFL